MGGLSGLWRSLPGEPLGKRGDVNLYHCANEGRGFFAEMGVADEQPVVLRSFAASGPLEDYAHGV